MSIKTFKDTWVEENTKNFALMYPDLSKKDLKKFLNKVFDEKVQDKRLIMDNNYINKAVNTSILEIYEWIQATQPIIAGHGVFYRNQNQSVNPPAKMIQKFLALRKQFKDMLKVYKEGTYDYDKFDRLQLTEKVNANSYYGVNGYKRSIFYNIYTATSVTSTGQSLISTSVAAFEQIMTNSVKFIDIDDFRHHIHLIINEEYELDEKILIDVPKEKVIERMLKMFLNNGGESKDVISFVTQTVNGLNQKQLNRVYYKNNIYPFSLIPEVRKIWIRVLENVGEFKNPNNVPDNISDDLEYLWELYEQFVVYNHFPFARIDRLKQHTRRSVVAEDTDSTMINLNPWVEFSLKYFGENNNKILSKDEDQLRFAIINSLCFILTKYITLILNTYTARSNILPDYRKFINMKNEFLFGRLFLSPVKKRYISTMRLREGKELWPEKIDIKGKHCPIWQ